MTKSAKKGQESAQKEEVAKKMAKITKASEMRAKSRIRAQSGLIVRKEAEKYLKSRETDPNRLSFWQLRRKFAIRG